MGLLATEKYPLQHKNDDLLLVYLTQKEVAARNIENGIVIMFSRLQSGCSFVSLAAPKRAQPLDLSFL